MAGLCAPLSTLRRHPRGYRRMTRGQCGSLDLHCKRLALSTPCRSSRRTENLEKKIPHIKRKDLQKTAVELLATVEEIERLKPAAETFRHNNLTQMEKILNVQEIDKLKVAALHFFRVLASATGGVYPLPEPGRLGNVVYFTQEEADAPLSVGDLRG